jgi:hypothetical protein
MPDSGGVIGGGVEVPRRVNFAMLDDNNEYFLMSRSAWCFNTTLR